MGTYSTLSLFWRGLGGENQTMLTVGGGKRELQGLGMKGEE